MALIKEEHFGIARKIVSNMTTESWREIPHAIVMYEADVTDILPVVKELNANCKRREEKITLNTVMMKIICEGLKAAPSMNTHLLFNRRLVRGCLKYFDHIDVSMPMLLPDGQMMTVNMRDMGNKTLSEMTAAIVDTERRARNSNMDEVMYEVSLDNTLQRLKQGKVAQTVMRLIGSKTGAHKVTTLHGAEKKKYYSIPATDRLTKKDIEQGTTTISNIGSIYREHKGSCALLEIIPPQTTAFAIDSIQKRPRVMTDAQGNDTIAVRQILPITIAMDHRALDYNDIVPFMRKLDEIFANAEVLKQWK